MSKEYCAEHGLVNTATDEDSDILRCPFCEAATSTTADEAQRFAAQD